MKETNQRGPMIFQTLDDKSECVGVYVDGKLNFDSIPTGLTKTWKYTGSVRDPDIEYVLAALWWTETSRCMPRASKRRFFRVAENFQGILEVISNC